MRTSSDLLSLAGRRVMITGAASGIGRAMALRFAEAGAELVLVDKNAAELGCVAKELSADARRVTTQVVDLAVHSQIDELWQRLAPDLPDTLINNAGTYPMRAFLEADARYVQHTLAVNLESVLWMCQAFIAARKKQGGVIVNVSSVEALVPFRDDLIPYSVSKAGVLALTRSLAHAYGRGGFRVNVLIPGAIKTPATQRLRDAAVRHLDVDLMKTGFHFGARLPLGRWGDADEVARVALFLASDLASYVQGSAIPVDGGFLSS